jgi:hypothetical protein
MFGFGNGPTLDIALDFSYLVNNQILKLFILPDKEGGSEAEGRFVKKCFSIKSPCEGGFRGVAVFSSSSSAIHRRKMSWKIYFIIVHNFFSSFSYFLP